MGEAAADSNLWHPRHWPAWAGMGVLWALTQLPHRARLALGRGLGWLAYRVIPKRREIARQNIGRCFPELSTAELDRMVVDHFAALGMGVMEVAMAWWADDKAVTSLVSLEGIEHIDQALARGRGLIVLSAHFTSLELGGRRVSQHTRLDVTYRHMNNPVSNAIMTKARLAHYGMNIHRDNVKGLIRQLKNNRPVWFAPDQKYRGKSSVMAKFFGQPVATNPAVARLSRITGAAVVPNYFKRLPDGRYKVVFLPPLEDYPSGDLQQDTQRMNDVFEEMIREAPEQYFWVHNRFS